MALVPATITISFTSNYVGCHRLYWRKTPSGTYTGPIEATPPCTGGGNPCTISFNDIVDTDACVAIEYNGYVQACCESEASTTGRIPWTVTFTPTPTCLPITITCAAVGVAGFNILNAGSGYVGTEDPNVVIAGGGGAGAAGTIVIGTGDLTAILVNTPGVGPGSAPAAYPAVNGVNFITTVPGVFTVVVNATTLNTLPGPYPNAGFTYVNAVTLVSSTTSSNWTVGDTFEIAFGDIGGVVGFLAEVTATDAETITGITLTLPGSGYSSPPIVTIAPPDGGGGVQATAEAIMEPCPDAWTIGLNCRGVDYSAFPIEPPLGAAWDMCLDGGAITSGTLPPEYTAAINITGCCSDCVSLSIFNDTLVTLDVAYVSCDVTDDPTYKDVQTITVAPGATEQICCVVKDSWVLSFSTDVTVTEGTCDCTP
jgi:hypothetical protein